MLFRSFSNDQRGFARVIGNATDIGSVEAMFEPFNLSAKVGSRPGNGLFQITFSNLSGGHYSVYASTNFLLPIGGWSNIGSALESPPNSGFFRFNDSQSDNFPRRFYRVITE